MINSNKSSHITLITPSNLGPYHRARYSALGAKLKLTIVKTPIKEFHRPWSMGDTQNIPFDVIDQLEHGHSLAATWRMIKDLFTKLKPDVIICIGYNKKFIWLTSLWARLTNTPCLLYLVSWGNEYNRQKWKEFPKRIYCKLMFTGVLATGQNAKDYAQTLGFSDSKIHLIGNPIDNDHFASSNKSHNSIASQNPRRFITVGRLHHPKNLIGLFNAFATYKANGGTWALDIAGSGPDSDELIAYVAENQIPDISWLGWVSYDDLPSAYHQADCFVISSFRDTWGLVINEAMAAGLPVLVSTQCGCLPELCHEGINGFRFNPYDIPYLTELFHKIENMSLSKYNAMCLESKRIIKNYDLDCWVDAMTTGTKKLCP